MARKIRQRSRRSRIITLVVAGGGLLVLHLALAVLFVTGHIDGYMLWSIEIFMFLDIPYIVSVVYFLRDDLKRWMRSRRNATPPITERRP